MRRVADAVRRHARYRAAILLQGESGTGKDVVARAIHMLSQRSGAYVPINVAAITESLADAELFGHRRGAFTGAVGSREGAFEQAHRGTLFLDEVAELPHAMQVKLLRVVEDGVVRPIGGHPLNVDVRIVSASWADLADRVEQGRFRGDLFHRLGVVVVRLPSLRQRKSDVPALAQALLARFEPDLGPKRITSAALARLVGYDWPGNVRELSGVLYRAAVSAEGACIDGADIDRSLPRNVSRRPEALSAKDARAVLEAHNGNISAAARAARVARSTFRSWLERAG
jgi:DNA-binding NtrC family response regulator